ncbi:NADP-dependent oxidoreductase [Gordonia sp. LSe1-13]|uniref:NADP-dependent oxidoreductase n=1 Tax=Gordonia sesuvii TaxID=3116777 RepID=A0ABU7MJ48_9ACTN|nr:NADP-dependent oxidoreductase [Gordonia sp. LSe1-13]
MVDKNRRWLLAQRPSGIVGPEHFELVVDAVPSIADGEFLVRNRWLSCDPAQRTYMEFDSYIPAVQIGELMVGASVGEVVESKHPDFQVGDVVSGAFGWQEYAVSDGSPFGGLIPPVTVPDGVDAPTALSLFGITGLTAYIGLIDVARVKAGDTVVVSGALGAVGSVVCQIAKLKGCRVVGIAGGPRKCDLLRAELGVNEAIDYKNDDVDARLGETCPDGIDVFFDNVGGEILDAALAHIAVGARIALCGSVSGYSESQGRSPITNAFNLTLQRATMTGFLVFDHLDRAPEATADLATWAAQGQIKNQIDVVEGLENAPTALRRLFTGENVGKQLVRLAD